MTPDYTPVRVLEHFTLMSESRNRRFNYRAGTVIEFPDDLIALLEADGLVSTSIDTPVDPKKRGGSDYQDVILSEAEWDMLALAEIDGIPLKRVFALADFTGSVRADCQEVTWQAVTDADAMIATGAAVELPFPQPSPNPMPPYYGAPTITL